MEGDGRQVCLLIRSWACMPSSFAGVPPCYNNGLALLIEKVLIGREVQKANKGFMTSMWSQHRGGELARPPSREFRLQYYLSAAQQHHQQRDTRSPRATNAGLGCSAPVVFLLPKLSLGTVHVFYRKGLNRGGLLPPCPEALRLFHF